MAVSGTVPARPRVARFDPAGWARWIRRATFVFAAACLIWVFASFGTRWVPAGMNTVPAIAAGSWCLVDVRRSAVQVGSDVFVEVPGSGLLLSRVTHLDADTVSVQNPNPDAGYPDSRVFGALPRACLRGKVVCSLAPG